MLKFNTKKFLSLPVNDGNTFYTPEDECGCAKFNFAKATEKEVGECYRT